MIDLASCKLPVQPRPATNGAGGRNHSFMAAWRPFLAVPHGFASLSVWLHARFDHAVQLCATTGPGLVTPTAPTWIASLTRPSVRRASLAGSLRTFGSVLQTTRSIQVSPTVQSSVAVLRMPRCTLFSSRAVLCVGRSDTSPTPGLPNAQGSLCFLSAADCETATNTKGECIKDSTTCGTGQAGPTSFVYIHTLDQPSVTNGVPNGGGTLCFGSQADCEASNNNPCGPNPPSPMRCSADAAACATGPAGPLPVTFTCRASYPPGALPSGGGILCYDSYPNCVGGPNACGGDITCVMDPSVCSTGMAGPSSNKYFCPKDLPPSSLPNGGGQLCYNSVGDCLNGPNYCTDSATCVTNAATCGTGMVGPMKLNTFCQFDQPNTQAATPATPGSLPAASGANCYFSQSECLTGPNACTDATACLPDYVTCSTGQAGPTNAWFFCQGDLKYAGAVPNGGGQLCYLTAGDCSSGPNSCGDATPCERDLSTCSTGVAAPAPNKWFCPLDTPVGLQTSKAALSSGSGMLCWASVEDCAAGPNGCTAAAADCVRNEASVKACSTGMAAGGDNKVACLKDFPAGGVSNAAGKWCYDTLGNCLNGTNACSPSVPCVRTPAAVCATAGSTNGYYCALDYPVDVAKGLSSLGNLCYQTVMDCINGPNACSEALLCDVDRSSRGACLGSSFTYFCARNNAAGTPAAVEDSSPGCATPPRLSSSMVGRGRSPWLTVAAGAAVALAVVSEYA